MEPKLTGWFVKQVQLPFALLPKPPAAAAHPNTARFPKGRREGRVTEKREWRYAVTTAGANATTTGHRDQEVARKACSNRTAVQRANLTSLRFCVSFPLFSSPPSLFPSSSYVFQAEKMLGRSQKRWFVLDESTGTYPTTGPPFYHRGNRYAVWVRSSICAFQGVFFSIILHPSCNYPHFFCTISDTKGGSNTLVALSCRHADHGKEHLAHAHVPLPELRAPRLTYGSSHTPLRSQLHRWQGVCPYYTSKSALPTELKGTITSCIPFLSADAETLK